MVAGQYFMKDSPSWRSGAVPWRFGTCFLVSFLALVCSVLCHSWCTTWPPWVWGIQSMSWSTIHVWVGIDRSLGAVVYSQQASVSANVDSIRSREKETPNSQPPWCWLARIWHIRASWLYLDVSSLNTPCHILANAACDATLRESTSAVPQVQCKRS